jgi:hypothetical protein
MMRLIDYLYQRLEVDSLCFSCLSSLYYERSVEMVQAREPMVLALADLFKAEFEVLELLETIVLIHILRMLSYTATISRNLHQ